MASTHTINPETTKPSNSSKRTSGARHAYLSRVGVVIVSADAYRETLALELAAAVAVHADSGTVDFR